MKQRQLNIPKRKPKEMAIDCASTSQQLKSINLHKFVK